ncbi:MAG: flagellar hook-basal body complex protein FliE [Stellaceae bacterium]
MTGAIPAMDGIASAMTALAKTASAPLPQFPAPAAPGAGQPSFSDLFSAAVGRLDGSVATAETGAASFASGKGNLPLSDVMIGLEQAGLALQMAANVRDKVIAAYTDIMNMPV